MLLESCVFILNFFVIFFLIVIVIVFGLILVVIVEFSFWIVKGIFEVFNGNLVKFVIIWKFCVLVFDFMFNWMWFVLCKWIFIFFLNLEI